VSAPLQVVGQVYVLPQPLLTGPQSAAPPVPVHAVVSRMGVQTGGPASIVVVPPSGRGTTVVEPQTFGTPAPPHDSPLGQGAPVPHVTVPPQPSAITPQFIGMPVEVTQTELGVAGTQPAVPPHTFGVPPPPHVAGGVHVTHGAGMTPPHPSPCGPQSEETLGSLHVLGVQLGLLTPQTLGTPPPPQVAGLTQLVGQLSVPLQPSLTTPQSAMPPAPVHAVVTERGVHGG
jgi:hypothetical protein